MHAKQMKFTMYSKYLAIIVWVNNFQTPNCFEQLFVRVVMLHVVVTGEVGKGLAQYRSIICTKMIESQGSYWILHVLTAFKIRRHQPALSKRAITSQWRQSTTQDVRYVASLPQIPGS